MSDASVNQPVNKTTQPYRRHIIRCGTIIPCAC